MQTPYQQLAAPQPVYAVAVPAAASAPASTGCCPCCVEPGCCSRVGSCPCFCTGYTASFSVALCSTWLALPMLATALALDVLDLTFYQAGFAWIGMWQGCIMTYGDYYSDDQCDNLDSDTIDSIFGGSAALFQAMRALAVASTALTLLAGILGAVRLARQQRSKANSTALNAATMLSGLMAVVTAALSFGFTFQLQSAVNDTFTTADWYTNSSLGAGWVMLTVGMGLLVLGSVLHAITQCCYSRSVAAAEQEGGEQSGMYVSAGYPAASVFTHPTPLQPAVLYPTAAAVHYPPPTAQYGQPGYMY